jgi:uncharacterized protein (TIGR04255 family)
MPKTLGAFWQTIREYFPIVEDIGPLPPPTDSADDSFKYEISDLPPMRRAWMVSSDSQYLIQVQEDRFIFNWKFVNEDVKYPGYYIVVGKFECWLEKFMKFLKDEGVGPVKFIDFELTYVNHIIVDEALSFKYYNALVDHKHNDRGRRYLPDPLSIHWRTRYALPGSVGRLDVTAFSGVHRTTKRKFLRLDMSAAGSPTGDPNEMMRSWFDLAHEWIVNGFCDVTDPELQQQWGRKADERRSC